MAHGQYHALVFGASGVSGWAIAKECLSYPSASTFSRVTALTNRPLSLEDSMLPKDSRLHLASGVDLTKSVDQVVALLKQNVPSVETVTHVFFTAYIEKPDYPSLRSVNTELIKNAINAVNRVAGSSLQHVILQTGGKAYGVEFVAQGVEVKPPLKESQPRIPPPFGDNIFYYPQYDSLAEIAKGKSWSFTEVRPDVIVGYTPGSNFMNVAQGLGFYLTLFKAVHGENAECAFIGTEKSWKNTHTDTSQDILARFEIYAALHPNECGSGKIFNASDGPVVTWSEKWPRICSHFGLKGTGPSASPNSGEMGQVDKFAKQHQSKWQEIESKHSLKKGIFDKYSWGFLEAVTIPFDFDREYDMSAVRGAGFTEEVDTVKDGFIAAFDRMKQGKIIP